MARSNAARIKPQTNTGILRLEVVRTTRLSPHWSRVTLGGPEAKQFTYMGFDQWFRLALTPTPESEEQLRRLGENLSMAAYLRTMAGPKAARPIFRNYTVRAHRSGNGPSDGQGPEIDVDFVLHGASQGEEAGPAAAWARTCSPGDAVGFLDEGITFNPPKDAREFYLVADESGLPAVSGILESLPRTARGIAVIEVLTPDDELPIDAPPGVEVQWCHRLDPHMTPGALAVVHAQRTIHPDPAAGFGFAVGEQALATGMRRRWVQAGLPKDRIVFSGYWRAGRGLDRRITDGR